MYIIPFFMHHLAGALYRAFELTGKVPPSLTADEVSNLAKPEPEVKPE